MKKMILALLIGVFLVAGNSLADPIPVKVGDIVLVDTSTGAGAGGGPFIVKAPDGSFLFNTFCIEAGIFLGGVGQQYVVQNISSSVITGGANNTNPPIGKLSYAAAAIYSDWLAGKSVVGATDLDYQQAIWFAENEVGGVNNAVYKAFEKATDYNGVYAFNIDFVGGGQSQSLLVKDPVPEPATMLLLGFGLVGLAAFGRKKLA